MDIQSMSAALMARPGVAFAGLPQMNIPWVESPFFEELLREQGDLSESDRDLCRKFAEDGYVLIDVDMADFDRLSSRIIADAAPKIPPDRDRVQDLWKESEAVRTVALNPQFDRLLRLFYRREPIPFQTLNFRIGSQQGTHSDTVHFHSVPHRFMCGLWVALEDIDEENGPLHIYPGSHSAPCWNFHDLGLPSGVDSYRQYEKGLLHYIEAMGFRKFSVTIRKGQAVVWAANLLHGGDPILDASRTRHTQVTHFFFKDCLYYTPMHSDPYIGRMHLRNIVNIRDGNPVPNRYCGEIVRSIPHLPEGANGQSM